MTQAKAEFPREQGMAVAEEIRTETRLKAELRKKLEQRGIDWAAELDGDRLRVAVTKKRRELNDQSAS
ncbi:MAG TPA: hypothetical protein VF590_26345 [Isosphaeraceae bacterium]